jgi:large subunit ribosomal protein L4
MQIDVVNIEGKKVGSIDLADAVFGTEVKEYLLWEIVKAQTAAKRAGTHATKTREHVRGGGKKPYKQKGTGSARQGSTRAPNYVGGGKVRRAALASALSLRAKEKKLVVLDKLPFEAPKTKRLAAILKALGLPSAVVVDGKENLQLSKSARNLAASKYLAPEGLNVYDILDHEGLIMTEGAVRAIEARVQATPTTSDAAAA